MPPLPIFIVAAITMFYFHTRRADATLRDADAADAEPCVFMRHDALHATARRFDI